MPKAIADTELGITKTTDLTAQKNQIDSLHNRIKKLQADIEQRRNNLESNLKTIKYQKQAEIANHREQYDKYINKGEEHKASTCMKAIRKISTELESIAKNILNSDSDISDLKARKDELRLEVLQLYEITRKNFLAAQKQTHFCSSMLDLLSSSIGRDFLKIGRIVDENKKVAEQVLAD